jgi:hypothetical protein
MSLDMMGFNFTVALAASGLAVVTGAEFLPKPSLGDYFRVDRFEVVRGEPNTIDVDRTILQPIVMGFTVRIMERVGDGYSQFCKMEAAPFQYVPNAKLPDPATLGWWTDKQCPNLPDGPARVYTTWLPSVVGMQPLVVYSDVEAKTIETSEDVGQ